MGCVATSPLPPTGPKGPHFGTQGPTFRVQIEVKDGDIDDMFSPWNSNKQEINLFIEHPNSSHPTVKFMAEISENETTFLNTTNYKGERLKKNDLSLKFVHITSRLKPYGTHARLVLSSLVSPFPLPDESIL